MQATCSTDEGLANIGLLTHLQKLNVSDGEFTDCGAASICRLARLQQLDAADGNSMTDKGIASIAALTELRWLNLFRCIRITDVGLSSLRQLSERLLLMSCVEITDVGVASIYTLSLRKGASVTVDSSELKCGTSPSITAAHHHVIIDDTSSVTSSSSSSAHPQHGPPCWMLAAAAVRGPAWSILALQFLIPGTVYGQCCAFRLEKTVNLGALRFSSAWLALAHCSQHWSSLSSYGSLCHLPNNTFWSAYFIVT